MEALKNKIVSEGTVIGTEIVKVDMFLNTQLDTEFLDQVGAEFAKAFAGVKVDRILTAEASGIAIASFAARHFGYPPVVFARKKAPSTLTGEYYEAECKSFTKGTTSTLKVAKRFLPAGESILIIDDFLAEGRATSALAEIAEQADVTVAGIGVVIAKRHQGGMDLLQSRGYNLQALAVIDKITEDGEIIFED